MSETATLLDFVEHKPGCDAYICSECGYSRSYGCQGLHSGGWNPLPCTCGLDALLAAPLPLRSEQEEELQTVTRVDSSSFANSPIATTAGKD